MQPTSSRGFSLPELMVTLAILVVFASSAVPAMSAFIDQQRASAYVRQFSQHLAYARVAAASSNLPVRVCPMTGNDCAEQWHNLPVQLTLQYPDNSIKLLKELPSVSTTHKLIFNRDAITFRRDGSLNGFENGTFIYCGKEGAGWHYTLTVNQAGRNRLNKITSPCPE